MSCYNNKRLNSYTLKLLNKVIDATVVKQVMLTSSQNMTIKIIYDNTNDDDDDMIVMLIMMNHTAT